MLTRRQPPTGWALRPACSADAQTLSRLCASHAAYERIPCSAAGHAERLGGALEAGRMYAWLGCLHREAVGYASATMDFSTLAGAPFLHLDCLYLEAGGSGRGIYCNDQFAMFIHASADDRQNVSQHFLRRFLLKSCNG